MLLSTGALAQMYEPFPSGPGIEEKGSIIRCMPNKVFATLIDQKHLHLIAMQVVKDNDKAIKVISANADGDVVVANINPDETVCILDILNQALLSEGVVPPSKDENSRPPLQQIPPQEDQDPR